jgi:hypothetical protein
MLSAVSVLRVERGSLLFRLLPSRPAAALSGWRPAPFFSNCSSHEKPESKGSLNAPDRYLVTCSSSQLRYSGKPPSIGTCRISGSS